MNELVAAGEVIDLRFPKGQRTLSARASKLFHLLVRSASDGVAEDRLHRVPIAWLRNVGLKHMTVDEFIECVRELASTTIDVEVRDEADRAPHVKTGAFLSHIERDLDAERGELLFEFSRTMRYVFARSAYWAILDRRATLAFESRYAIRLYELMTLRSGLDRRVSETFELDDLRHRLGVPDGKLTRWIHLRQFAIEKAVAEVNHISAFKVRWEPIKHGRSVAAVRFHWSTKTADERSNARSELAQPRAGRKSRRLGQAEPAPLAPVPPSFPPSGTIGYGRWGELARKHAPSPTPDPDVVADRFRAFARDRKIHSQAQISRRCSSATARSSKSASW